MATNGRHGFLSVSFLSDQLGWGGKCEGRCGKRTYRAKCKTYAWDGFDSVPFFLCDNVRTSNSFSPLAGFGDGAAVEITDFGGGEGPAELAHALLPFLFADHRDALEIEEMIDVKLDVRSKLW